MQLVECGVLTHLHKFHEAAVTLLGEKFGGLHLIVRIPDGNQVQNGCTVQEVCFSPKLLESHFFPFVSVEWVHFLVVDPGG